MLDCVLHGVDENPTDPKGLEEMVARHLQVKDGEIRSSPKRKGSFSITELLDEVYQSVKASIQSEWYRSQ